MRQNVMAIVIFLTVSLGWQRSSGSDGEITRKMIGEYEERVSENSSIRQTINAATNNSLKDLSLNRELITRHDPLFNFKVEGSKVVDQQSSGRCWMFAGTNAVTPRIMTKIKASDFKLSQAYLSFWDKLEKSNAFLEAMIELRDKDINDRSLQMYLMDPVGDGGWWHYFTSLIEKYGLVPASAMPETKQSSSTGSLNRLLNSLLRGATAELRTLHEKGKSVRDIRDRKEQILGDIYQMLVCAYGVPPKDFTFRWETEVDSVKSIQEKAFTPTEFFHEFYGEQIPEYVAISNNPSLPFDKTYRMESSRNVFEQPDLTVLNLPVQRLKEYAFKAIHDSQMVWFACDVDKDNFNDSGIFAVDIYDYNTTLGVNVKLTKADRISYHDMSPNHAMILKGADTASDGIPRKWLVENSWGTKKGNEGFWTMYDSWFDEYVLLVVVEKRFLDPADLLKWQQEPVIIEDWQPFFVGLKSLQ